METIISRHKNSDICARIFQTDGQIIQLFEFDKKTTLNNIIMKLKETCNIERNQISIVTSFNMWK